MALKRNEIATELLAIAEKLTRLAHAQMPKKAAVSAPKQVLEEVARKITGGQCLQCEEIKSETYRRGICAACYKRTKQQIDEHATTWEEIEASGGAVPKQQGRRAKETLLDKILGEKKAEQGRAALKAALKKP